MNTTKQRSGRLHYELIRGLVDTGVIPARAELQNRLGCSSNELDRAIDALAAEHGAVLHPGTRDIWVVHPFSVAPTPFVVRSGTMMWWGNCAWCSLGVAVLVDAPCVIASTFGAEGEPTELTVTDGRVDRADLVVHFPVPMVRAWDNVIYTCSTMLLFRNEREVAAWCARHRIPMGDVQPVTRVLELAKRWYGEHLRPDWTKKSVAEAKVIFSEVGLTHPVWALPEEAGRF